MNTAIVMLGSNFNRERMLEEAKTLLSKQFTIAKTSRILETEPVGSTSKTNYLNQAIQISTDNTIDSTVKSFKQIELELGRTPASKTKGEIPIDIDLIFWNNEIQSKDYEKFWFVRDCIEEINNQIDFSD